MRIALRLAHEVCAGDEELGRPEPQPAEAPEVHVALGLRRSDRRQPGPNRAADVRAGLPHGAPGRPDRARDIDLLAQVLRHPLGLLLTPCHGSPDRVWLRSAQRYTG